MKKFLCIVLLLFVVGCQKVDDNTAQKKLYFVFATPLSEHEIWLQAKAGFDQACRDYDINCEWIGPTAIDIENMEEVIHIAISQKADGIITQGVISDDLVNKALVEGVPVVLVDSDMAHSNRVAYLGKDFSQQAKLFLQDIELRLGKNEYLNIAIQVAEKDFLIAQNQIEEIEKVFMEHPGGYKITSISESKSDYFRSKKEWMQILKDNAINVAINFAGESVIACSEVASLYGSELLIYGVDDMPETIQLLRNGKIAGSVVTSFYKYGYDAVVRLYEYQVKQQHAVVVERVKLILVTPENVKTYKEELK